MQFVNCTPHVIRLNNGEVQGLPDPKPGTRYIVSAMVAGATNRMDVVVPATGHPECIRKDGQVYAVPGFIVK